MHVITTEFFVVWLLCMLVQFEVHPYVYFYNLLGCNLISVLDLANSLGRRLMSAHVLTSHLKCQTILLILLCLVALILNSPRLFLVSISLIFAINQPLLKYMYTVQCICDIKLRPSALVRVRTDIKLQPIELVRSYKNKYTC